MRIPRAVYFLSLIMILYSCGNDLQEVKETADQYKPAQETGKEITMLYTENGTLRVKLISPRIVRVQVKNPYIEFPDGLNLYFYNELKEVESTLTAKYGIRYEKEEKTIFRDSVVMVNTENETLVTDELIWDENKEKVFSTKWVKIIRSDERITGTGFEANQDFTDYKIFNTVGEFDYVDPDSTSEDL